MKTELHGRAYPLDDKPSSITEYMPEGLGGRMERLWKKYFSFQQQKCQLQASP